MAVVDYTADGAVLRVSAGYSLKLPIDGVDYGMEDAHASFSVEVPLNGTAEDLAAVVAAAEQEYDQLEAAAKLAVFTQLEVTPIDGPTGALRPGVKKAAPRAAAQAQAPRPPRAQAQQSGSFSPPKASKEQVDALPRVTLGGEVYIDQRPLKDAQVYAQGAADFKPVAKGGRSLWIASKNGTVNDETARLMEEAGVV